jgi:hypothetical protein
MIPAGRPSITTKVARYTGTVRPLILLLALAISPVALTVCQLTCSAHVAGHQHAAEVPSCHESMPESDGPALKPDNLCRHSEGDLLLAKAPPVFQLSVVPTEASTFVVLIERPTDSLEATAIPSASSPLLLLPLRI